MTFLDMAFSVQIILVIILIAVTLGGFVLTRNARKKYKTEVLDYYKEQHNKKTLPKDTNKKQDEHGVEHE